MWRKTHMLQRPTGQLSRRGILSLFAAGLLAGTVSGLDRTRGIRMLAETSPTPPTPSPLTNAAPPPTAQTTTSPTSLRILTCDGWNARQPSEPVTILNSRPNKIVVHHTATANADDVDQAALITLAKAIQDFHMDHNDWIDTGQHFTVNRGGLVAEGRHRSLETLTGGASFVEGTHCVDQNDVSIGIENQGTYTDVVPPTPLRESLARLLAYCAAQYQLNPAQIYGHRDFNDTDCPGDKLYALLPALRYRVGQLLGTPIDQATASPPVWPLLRPGATGPTVMAAQHLLRGAGQAALNVGGTYDTDTVSAVKRFQTSRGLDPTGLLGGASWPLLTAPTAAASASEAAQAARLLRASLRIQTGANAEGASDAGDTPTTKAAWQRLLDAATP